MGETHMDITPLAQAFADLDDVRAAGLVEKKIKAGEPPLAILAELQTGMAIFNEQCRTGNFFISDLILAGDIFQQSMRLLEPVMDSGDKALNGPLMVLGTAQGDIHNLGKDIFGVLLKAAGFRVHDLGVDVPPRAFVDAVSERGAALVGISGLITPSFDGMKATVEALAASGLRQKVQVIIGGGVVNEMACRYCGADAFTTDAIQGIEWCLKNGGGRSK
jgi:dimethylamine corrinoid protein